MKNKREELSSKKRKEKKGRKVRKTCVFSHLKARFIFSLYFSFSKYRSMLFKDILSRRVGNEARKFLKFQRMERVRDGPMWSWPCKLVNMFYKFLCSTCM